MSYCVYCHTNKINGKKYVGITKQKPEKRWGNGCNYTANEYFYNAIKKYGWEEFSHEILFTGLTKTDAQNKEVELISKWQLNDRNKGYNIQKGGEGVDSVSDETRLKISKAKKGQRMSVESRLKMSISRTGKGHFRSVPVAQYDDNGNKLAEFSNSREAERATGIESRNIRKCISGERQHAGGFVWKKIHF
jgi:hypothetical protein